MAEQTAGEKVFFEDSGNNVRVTSARAILGNKTYPMANISSVSIGTTPANRTAAGCLALLGVVALLGVLADAGTMWLLGGLLLIAVAVVAFKAAKPTYSVRIGAAGGESDGFTSTSRDLITKVVEAMNDAIVSRG